MSLVCIVDIHQLGELDEEVLPGWVELSFGCIFWSFNLQLHRASPSPCRKGPLDNCSNQDP